ncbi:hypothetical protein BKA70DRAFT_705270 [Coprinopsis sp. MPI-PUGE-AT-0042]|nr:hypothetical protein BKA70DRAFT_705270 [Coprinopsis sp. MPI-PUGE-AT-0042]
MRFESHVCVLFFLSSRFVTLFPRLPFLHPRRSPSYPQANLSSSLHRELDNVHRPTQPLPAAYDSCLLLPLRDRSRPRLPPALLSHRSKRYIKPAAIGHFS